MLYAARYGTIDSTAGSGYELQVIAAVVVGGVAIFGGSGSVVGAAFGALLLNTILSALYVLGVSPFWNQAIAGALLLGAIALDRGISLQARRRAAEARGRTLAPESLASGIRGALRALGGRPRRSRSSPSCVFGVSASSQFLTSSNFFYLNLSIGEIAIMALPMTLIIVTGEIDLSVASILGHVERAASATCSATAGRCRSRSSSVLARRRGGGRVQRLPRHAGRAAVARGDDRDADAVPRHRRVILLGPNTISDFPAQIHEHRRRRRSRTPAATSRTPSAIFIVLAIVFGVVLHATPFGRSLFVMGANEEAARFAGIRVKRTKLILFVGLRRSCARSPGSSTRSASRPPCRTTGSASSSSVVTIVLLGGVSIFGGEGTIIGVVLAIARLRRAAERAVPDQLQPAGDWASSPARCCC